MIMTIPSIQESVYFKVGNNIGHLSFDLVSIIAEQYALSKTAVKRLFAQGAIDMIVDSPKVEEYFPEEHNE